MVEQLPFDLQQSTSGLPGIATDAGSRNDTMTGHEQRPGIFPAGAAYGTRAGTETFRQLRITDRPANADASQLPPDPLPEFRALA